MIEYTKEPKMNVSPMAREQAGKNGWATIIFFGVGYSVPVTKEMKRLFGMKRRGSEWLFGDQRTGMDFEKVMMDTIAAVYLQVRDVVGAGVREELSKQLENSMSEMFAPFAAKAVESAFEAREQKLLTEGNSNGTNQ